MRDVSRLTWILLVLGVAGGLVTCPLYGFISGAAKLGVISRYRELDLSGAIDHEVVIKTRGAECGRDWFNVAEWLIGSEIDMVKRLALAQSILYFVNAGLCVAILRAAVRGRKERGVSSDPAASCGPT